MRFILSYALLARWRAILKLVLVVTVAPLAHAAEPPPGRGEQLPTQPSAPQQRAAPLAQLVAEALQNNPEIQAARKEREAASQRVAPAGSLDDPMLEAGVINVPTDSFRFDREDMTMKMIGLSQRLPYPGKRGLREEVATREMEAADFYLQEIVNRTVRDLKVAYFDLGVVHASTQLVEKNKAILDQFLRVAETRYAVGQGNQADVLKAQTQLSKMMEEIIKLGRERSMLEAEISRALGRGLGAAPAVPEAAGLRETPLELEALHELALRSRPLLLALQSAIARSDKMLELARKDYYPDFDVRFSYGQRDSMPDGTKRSDMVSLTLAINLPVWRETKRGPRLAEAQAMREQAQRMYEAQRNELAMKLRQQVAATDQNLRSARLYQRDILPQSRLTVEAALAAYRVNRVDFMTLLDNQMSVFNFEIAHAAAISAYNKALAEIDLLTGRSPN
jgi:cobalt-zinc-cadmium efflux system outer membrane protein